MRIAVRFVSVYHIHGAHVLVGAGALVAHICWWGWGAGGMWVGRLALGNMLMSHVVVAIGHREHA